jgi:hypothetical protein
MIAIILFSSIFFLMVFHRLGCAFKQELKRVGIENIAINLKLSKLKTTLKFMLAL